MQHCVKTLLLLIAICLSLDAHAAPLGPEFKVNVYTTGDQKNPSVAGLRNGGFVVVWQSPHDNGTLGIYGRRYNAVGVPVGVEFKVNTYSPGSQVSPSVAALKGGGFVVVWGSPNGICGQRFNGLGVPLGSEFQVDSNTTGFLPAVAGLFTGGFVVTWQAFDAGQLDVFAQRYNAAGTKLGGEFRANTTTAQSQYWPAVAGISNGGFVITWGSGNGTTRNDIYARRYTQNGAPAGLEFLVNTNTVANHANPQIAGPGRGGFVITFDSKKDGDGSSWGVFGRRFANSGVPIGGEFQINTTTAGSQYYSSIAALADSGFIVTWTSAPDGGVGSGFGVFGKRYNRLGVAVSPEVPVNTFKPDHQSFSSAAGLANGGMVVVWSSKGQDGDGWGIYGQRYGP